MIGKKSLIARGMGCRMVRRIAELASLSAASLPVMPRWPGTQSMIGCCVLGSWLCVCSMRWMSGCVGFMVVFLIASMADLESVAIMLL